MRPLWIYVTLLATWKLFTWTAERLVEPRAAALAGYVLLLGGLGLVALRSREGLGSLFAGAAPRHCVLGGVAGLGLFVLGLAGYAVSMRLLGAEMSAGARAFFTPQSLAGWALTLSIAGLAALTEELLYRGLLLGELTRLVHPWAAALVTALAFSALHLSALQIVSTLLLGLGLAWLTLATGNLAAAVVAHLTYNALGLVLMVLGPRTTL